MKTFALALTLTFAATAAMAAPQAIPLGQLPGDAVPRAYRLALDIDPSRADFTGNVQIDVTLRKSARIIYLHGNGLRVSAARLRTPAGEIAAKYSEVDSSGVAQLELASEAPAGDATLTIDYAATYSTGAEGLFRVQVGDDWYVWSQFEPIDARRAFPCFDEPGFKTPFTVSVTAPKAVKVFANSSSTGTAPKGDSTTHRFAPTAKLPTYLVAIGVGPFDVVEMTAPANEVRKKPLAMRIIATRGQLPRMQFAARETPRLLELTEKYLGIPYPFSKLDLLATPILGGAMENAGLIISDDTLLLMDDTAPQRQLRLFAEVQAHEIAHQWFGDLVTPTWWTDIWLNESFAEWLGKKIGDQWRPGLGIATLGVQDAFEGMATDSLGKGRPIRQTITENSQVVSAFDTITYQKGGQVLAMFESYLGPEKFAKGVQLHLSRYRNGNATADDFFRSLAEAAKDTGIVAAMRTFTDQTGVPVVSVKTDKDISLAQSRYRPLGVPAGAPQTWAIPLCLARGAARSCSIFAAPQATVPALAGSGPLMPNANGAGYYRFRLDDAGWDALTAAAPTLPGRDALTFADSLWADFAAGSGSFARVLAAARGLSSNPERLAVIELAQRLQLLSISMLEPEQRESMRAVFRSIYSPRLAAIGFDPAAGAGAQDPEPRKALRQSLVPLVALAGRDAAVRQRLLAAAEAFLDGNTNALDPSMRVTAFSVGVQERGVPFMTRVHDAMLKSNDSFYRQDSAIALGAADTPALAKQAVEYALAPDLKSLEGVRLLFSLAGQPEARDVLDDTLEHHFKQVLETFPGFARTRVVGLFGVYCSQDALARIDRIVVPELKTMGGGELELAQTRERVGLCMALKEAKGAEIAKELAD